MRDPQCMQAGACCLQQPSSHPHGAMLEMYKRLTTCGPLAWETTASPAASLSYPCAAIDDIHASLETPNDEVLEHALPELQELTAVVSAAQFPIA